MQNNNMFVLKIKGNGKIPDHIQVRDDNFTLIAYFKSGNHYKALSKWNLLKYENEFIAFINNIPYGQIKSITFNN